MAASIPVKLVAALQSAHHALEEDPPVRFCEASVN